MKFLVISGSYRSGTTFIYKALNANKNIKLLYQPFIQFFKYIDFEIRKDLKKKTFENFPLGLTITKKKINLEKIILKKKNLISISKKLIEKNKKDNFLTIKEKKLYVDLYRSIFFEIRNNNQVSAKNFIKMIFNILKKILNKKKIQYVGFKEPFLGNFLESLLTIKNTYVINLIRDPREILCSRNYSEKKSNDFRQKKHPVIMISLICQRNMQVDYKLKDKKKYLSLNFNDFKDIRKIQKKINKFLKLKINLNFINTKKNNWKINSSGNSRNYGSKWMDKTKIEEIAIIEKICAKYFKKYNYKAHITDDRIKSNLVMKFKEKKKDILNWTNRDVFLKYNRIKLKNL